MSSDKRENKLLAQIRELEEEVARLKTGVFTAHNTTVKVPEDISELFREAHKTVQSYFSTFSADPSKGKILIGDERYVLMRASALSYDFLSTIQRLYADRGPVEAMRIGKNFLFDLTHAIGMSDAKKFYTEMNVAEPINRLAAGPVLFSHFGWAMVDILENSKPEPNEDYFMMYHHDHSFEADSWIDSGVQVETPVCIMNAGYSSGWCEASFGVGVTAVEISCRARGDEKCTFIMAPPSRMREHLENHMHQVPDEIKHSVVYEIPTFFERKRVEESLQVARKEAEESAHLKSQFLANMSHEIRTPLNGVIGMTELLLESDLSPKQLQLAQDARMAGESLLAIVNDILDFSKIEAGKIDVVTAPFSIHALLRQVSKIFSSELDSKHLDFSTHTDPSIPETLIGDNTRIRQILVNLLGNAIKFTNENGSISVNLLKLSETQSQVTIRIEVQDSGCGIAAAKLENIFDPFTQEDPSVTRKHGGTGLGLSICAELVKLMDGTIEVSSEIEKGSLFSVVLPLRKPIEQPTDLSENQNFPALHILLVEDNAINKRMATMVLEKAGHTITTASDGDEAVQLCKDTTYDIILMDIQMPKMSGDQAVEIIRSDNDGANFKTPIIATTANILKEQRTRYLNGGFNACITKPIRRDELLEIIHELSITSDVSS